MDNTSYELTRYSVIEEKNPREIILLRGKGCVWKKCTFCDYHQDFSLDNEKNFMLNSQVIGQVTGKYGFLEIINSGSFFELDTKTIDLIVTTCKKLNINNISIESHWIFKDKIQELRKKFYPININCKIGIETFDIDFRENIMKKGMGKVTPMEIKQYFQDCCLLVGVEGQTQEQILSDINIANEHFTRVCINVFVENKTSCKADNSLIQWFIEFVYPKYKDIDKFDILLNNTDFGVG